MVESKKNTFSKGHHMHSSQVQAPDSLQGFTRLEIVRDVKQILIDALGVDEEEVTPDAHVHSELGAESIDYLDISFQCEKKFGIKFDRGIDSIFGRSHETWMKELKEHAKTKGLDYDKLNDWDKGTLHREFPQFPDFRVSVMVDYIQGILAAEGRFVGE